jgi:hypothetical protein
MMNKAISSVSAGLLTILTGLIAVPARAQTPNPYEVPNSSQTPNPYEVPNPYQTPKSSQTPSPSSTSSPSSIPSPSSGTSSPSSGASSSPSSGTSVPVGGNLITKFQCATRKSDLGEILIRANGYYTLSTGTGKYQAIPQGYRFLTGSLREQSIIKSKKGFILVSSKDEAKNTSLSMVDELASCDGGTTFR